VSGRADAIIVGGGHNGLVAAAYLAKAGKRVTVLEARPILGGSCVTEEPFPGFRLNTLAYAAGLLRPQIIHDLELERFGLEVQPFEPQYFAPFPDRKHLFIWTELSKTLKEIERFSKKDAQAYARFEEFWAQLFEVVEPALLAPPAPIADLAAMFRGAEAEDVLRKMLLVSTKDLLDEWFEDEHVRALLATQGLIGTYAGPMTPGTGYVLGHHLLGEIGPYKEVWGWAKGGMSRIPEAIAAAARHYGAEIRVNAPVKQILTNDSQAVGVELASGERLESKVVISNADPKRTFLSLVDADALEPQFLDRVRKIKAEGSAMKVNLCLSELPDYTAYPGKGPGPTHTGSTDICHSVEYLERAWDDAKYGRPSEHPWFEAVSQSAVDPSVAPPGKHTLSLFVMYAPYHLRSGTWDDVREEVGDRVVDTLAEYAPNIKRAILHRQVITPLDLERTYHLTEGNIFHAEILPDQIFSFRPMPGWANYRTPVEGLYLCGAGTHPGGGILGACGYNAAHTVLDDLGATEKA